MLVAINDFSSTGKYTSFYLSEGGPTIVVDSNGLYNVSEFFNYYSVNFDRWLNLSKTKELLKKCEQLYPNTQCMNGEKSGKYKGVYACSFLVIKAVNWISPKAYFDFLSLHEKILFHRAKVSGSLSAHSVPTPIPPPTLPLPPVSTVPPPTLPVSTPSTHPPVLCVEESEEEYFKSLMFEIDVMRYCLLA